MIYAGQIYYSLKYTFADGAYSDKLIIILNTPPNVKIPYIVCLTTSNGKFKPTSPGCYTEQGYYMMPENADWFIKDTWLELYRLEEFKNQEFNDKLQDKTFIYKGSLKQDSTNSIINCALNCIDITPYKADIIRECKAREPNIK